MHTKRMLFSNIHDLSRPLLVICVWSWAKKCQKSSFDRAGMYCKIIYWGFIAVLILGYISTLEIFNNKHSISVLVVCLQLTWSWYFGKIMLSWWTLQHTKKALSESQGLKSNDWATLAFYWMTTLYNGSFCKPWFWGYGHIFPFQMLTS